MENFAIKNPGRRNFLRTAPIAAAAGFALADGSLFASPAAGQSAAPAAAATIQLFTAQAIQEDIKALQAKPGNNNLEFEWHEGRDHVLQIMDGATVYEVGGTPKDGRNTKPGEWLAPGSDGAATLTLKKGDMLVIPRGTPHKRSTAESVTFLLISPMGTAKP